MFKDDNGFHLFMSSFGPTQQRKKLSTMLGRSYALLVLITDEAFDAVPPPDAVIIDVRILY